MRENRIGSHCYYKSETGLRPGILRAWSTDRSWDAEFQQYTPPAPVGIVEDVETGQIHSVYVNLISFKED